MIQSIYVCNVAENEMVSHGFTSLVGGHRVIIDKRLRERRYDDVQSKVEALEQKNALVRKHLAHGVSARISPRYQGVVKQPTDAPSGDHVVLSQADQELLESSSPQRIVIGGDKREMHRRMTLAAARNSTSTGGGSAAALASSKKLIALRKAIQENPLTHRDRMIRGSISGNSGGLSEGDDGISLMHSAAIVSAVPRLPHVPTSQGKDGPESARLGGTTSGHNGATVASPRILTSRDGSGIHVWRKPGHNAAHGAAPTRPPSWPALELNRRQL